MKKKKFPKYIQEKFNKAQFKVGDHVKYEFLGDSGWGYVTKIQKFNETVSYMVQGNGYSYPCGLQIKEHTSYYAGSIDYEASKNQKDNATTRNAKTKKRNDYKSRKRVSGVSSNTISNTGFRSSSANGIGDGNANNCSTNESGKKTIRNNELEEVIVKQKEFLRRFT